VLQAVTYIKKQVDIAVLDISYAAAIWDRDRIAKE
jgi:hypothetical protein